MDIAAWVTYFTTGTNWVIPALILWLAPWKLIALYRAARRGQWLTFLLFVVLVPVNDFGIVEMFYIFSWSRVRTADADGPVPGAMRTGRGFTRNPESSTLGSAQAKGGFFARSAPAPAPDLTDIPFSAKEIKDYKGPRSEAPAVKELPQTNGVGKIDMAGLSELERMRKLAKERGEQKSLTPPVPTERMTVRPDVPIPKPPGNREMGNGNRSVLKNDDAVLTPAAEVPKPSADVQTLMPGVFVPKRA